MKKCIFILSRYFSIIPYFCLYWKFFWISLTIKRHFFENLEASDCFIALGAPRKRQLTELQQPLSLKLVPKGFNQSPGRMYRWENSTSISAHQRLCLMVRCIYVAVIIWGSSIWYSRRFFWKIIDLCVVIASLQWRWSHLGHNLYKIWNDLFLLGCKY